MKWPWRKPTPEVATPIVFERWEMTVELPGYEYRMFGAVDGRNPVVVSEQVLAMVEAMRAGLDAAGYDTTLALTHRPVTVR